MKGFDRETGLSNSDQDESFQSGAVGENFSLASFLSPGGGSLEERTSPFSTYYRENVAEGRALYCREIVSAPGPRVRVRDMVSGEVRTMVMLGSNDYLGLACHPKVVRAVRDSLEIFGVGMGGPPLLNGMSSVHRRLERRLANLKHGEDALLFASGYQANLGWVPALVRPGDALIFDELSHASLFDGIHLARATHRFKALPFRHNDLGSLEAHLERARRNLPPDGLIYVSVEGVYSMDGDLAPLPEIVALCRRYDARLVLDDAHGTGVMGKTGAGTAEHFGVADQIDISMGTFSKSLGVTGGFLVAKRAVTDYLRFFSRSYMFSAHLTQSTAVAALTGLEVIAEEPELRASLHRNAEYLRAGLRGIGFRVESVAPIIPVAIDERVDIRDLSRRFNEEGVFVNAIEYPAVSKKAQRLRLSLMAGHTRDDLDFALGVFAKLGREFGLIPRGANYV